MSIVIDENTLGIWYVHLADDLDLMIALMRDGEGGYKVSGRTRQYASPDDPWDDKDIKRWFSGGIQAGDDADAVAKSRNNMIQMTSGYAALFEPEKAPAIFELVRGESSVEKFAETLKSMPWAHSMEATRH